VEVLFAFDMMRVRLGEFKQAGLFLPALRELLKEGEKAEGEEAGV
jgi:ribonuclease Z